MLRRWLGLGVVVACVALVGCKKTRRKGGNAAPRSAAAQTAADREFERALPADAVFVAYAPSVTELVTAYKPVIDRMPLVAARIDQGLAELKQSGLDLSKTDNFKDSGVDPKAPLAVLVRRGAPGDEPIALVALSLSSWDALRARLAKEELPSERKVSGKELLVYKDSNVVMQHVGDVALVSVNVKDFSDAGLALVVLGGSPLSDVPEWRRARELLGKNAQPLLYISPAELIRLEPSMGKTFADYTAIAVGVVPADGGAALRGTYWAGTKPDLRARLAATYLSPQKDSGIAELLPAEALFTVLLATDIPSFMIEMKRSFAKDPNTANLMAEAEAAIEDVLGIQVDFEKDFVARVTGRFGLTVGMPPMTAFAGGANDPGQIFAQFPAAVVLELRDLPGTTAALDRMTKLPPNDDGFKVTKAAGGWDLTVSGATVANLFIQKKLLVMATPASAPGIRARAGGTLTDSLVGAPLSPLASRAFKAGEQTVRYDLAPVQGLLAMLPANDPDAAIGLQLIRTLHDLTATIRIGQDGMEGDLEVRLAP